jgi:hypothetical protein
LDRVRDGDLSGVAAPLPDVIKVEEVAAED